MKNVFFALAFMLMGTFAFANESSTQLIKDNASSLNEISKVEIKGDLVIVSLNNSAETGVSVKCWLFRKWLVSKLKGVSGDTELINDTADAFKELCEIANDLGWI